MRKVSLFFICVLFAISLTGSIVAFGEEETSGQTWMQWHMSSGIADINDETGVATFTNSKNGDTSFSRGDMKFGFNGFKAKIKYGFQDKTSATPDALVAPPALTADNVETGYNMGLRIHLSSKNELNDSAPQLVLRIMPYFDGTTSNKATVNFWVSTGTGFDEGAWIFTKDLLADFYWDESQSNELSIQRNIDGKFYLTVNGKSEPFHQADTDSSSVYVPYKNLDTALDKIDKGQVHFVFWNNYSSAMSTKYASKVTVESLSSELPAAFENGMPYGQTLLLPDSAVFGYTEAGKLQLVSKAAPDFTITENKAERSLMGTGINLLLNKQMSEGDFLSYNLVSDGGNYAKLKLEKGSAAGKANISLIVKNGQNITTNSVTDIDFNFKGEGEEAFAIAKLLIFREKADFIVSVNDVRIDNTTFGLNSARLRTVMESLENSKIQLENKGKASIVLDGYVTKLPSSMPSGWTVGTDGTTKWDSDFEENSIIWAEDGIFSAAYNKEPAFLTNFGVNILVDKKDTATNLNIIISSKKDYYKKTTGGDSIIISLKKDGAKTAVTFKKYVKSSDTVTEIDSADITTMSWKPQQEVPMQFGLSEGNFKVFIRSSAVPFDLSKINAAVESIKASFTDNIAYVQFSCDGGEGSAITFLNMLHYLPGPAVIEGIQSNSQLPIFGAPAKEDDIVMTFSKNKGDTLRFMDKQALIDGFKITFDMFATPKPGMGHIVMALALKNTWHSVDTGIQIAITSSSVSGTSLVKANVGLSMTDAELGLSNTPLVNYNVGFNWRGSNTIELKKEGELWALKVNGEKFNIVNGEPVEALKEPVRKDEAVVATTITEILDLVKTRYGGNYSYLQMWNNFGEFTLALTEHNMVKINTPPQVKAGIKRDFEVKIDTKIRLDLNKFFTDSDGQIVSFTVDGGASVVDNHILEYTLSVKDEKKYINIRAYDERGDFGLVRISLISGKKTDLGGMNVDGEEIKEDGCGGCGTISMTGGGNGGGGLMIGGALLLLGGCALMIKRNRVKR